MNTMPDPTQTSVFYSGCSLLLVALLFSGCGEFAYKRGANAGDLETAKKSCQANAPDSAAVEKCMADNGWVVQNLDKMEPLDADPVVEASVIPSDRRIENAASHPPAKQAAEPPSQALSSSLPATADVKRDPGMLDTFKVSSWWKAGSSAESLKTDTGECVARLGEAHRPDNQTQTVTRGLLLCMKEKGWSGLRAK